MDKPQKQFGDIIKEFRKNRGITLDRLSKNLGISLSLLSDIENNRRSPLNEEQIELFAKRFVLSEKEKNELFDLAARSRGSVPEDIKNVIMYTPESDFVRMALRKTKAGKISKKDWEEFAKNNGCDGEDTDD